nr:hypothetical protein [Tanacetum cinerariifolium]
MDNSGSKVKSSADVQPEKDKPKKVSSAAVQPENDKPTKEKPKKDKPEKETSVNVQFLQQIQPEWSRFVTIVKQQHKLDEVSYHKLFDILKQYQNEVNELRAEKLARNANPLALVAIAKASQDPFYQSSRSHRSQAPSPKPSISTRSHTATRHKGKEIAKPITPSSETASEEDSDPKQAQRDKDMEIFWLSLLSTSRRSTNQPTTTSEHPQTSRTRMWIRLHADTDEEVDEQELEAHYSYMAKIQEVPNADSCTDSETVEQVQNDVRYNVFANGL